MKRKRKFPRTAAQRKGMDQSGRQGLGLDWNRWAWLCYLILAFAGIVVYSNSLKGEFIFDDIPQIVDNARIRDVWDFSKIFENTRRPVLYLTFAVNHALNGYNVLGYHIFNLAIHVLSGCVIFAILYRTFLTASYQSWWDPRSRIPLLISLGASLLWVIHPLNTQAVSYVVQRAESLAAFFYLVAIYCFIRFAENSKGSWKFASVGFCVLSMATKETGATAPLMIWLYDRIFLERSFVGAIQKRRGFYTALFLTWIVPAILLVVMNPETKPTAGFNMGNISPLDYFLTQAQVIVHYCKLSLTGGPLVFDYYDWPVVKKFSSVWPQWTVLFLAGLLTLRMVLLGSPVGYWAAWIFVILAPSSSVMPIKDVAFEYRMYLPLVGGLVLAMTGIYWVVSRFVKEKTLVLRFFLIGGLLFAVLRFAVMTFQRNEDYKTAHALWQDSVLKRPLNARAHNNFGQILFQEQKLDLALQHYEIAVHLEPDYADVHCNLGTLYIAKGNVDKGVYHMQRALAIDPNFAIAHNNMGALLADHSREFEQAVKHYQEAVRLNFKDPGVFCNLGIALVQLGRYDEAVLNFKEALDLNPDNVIAQKELRKLENIMTRKKKGE